MTYPERRTVVGYDGSRSARAALEWAAADAAHRRSELLVLHVAEWGPAGRTSAARRRRNGPPEDGSRPILQDALTRVRAIAPTMPVTLETALSGIARSLVEASGNAEMVVLGVPQSRTLEGRLLGDTTSSVVARASCPVVVVSPGDPAEAKPSSGSDLPITVGFDGSPGAERALDFAAARAAADRVPLVVVVAYSSLRTEVAPGPDDLEVQGEPLFGARAAVDAGLLADQATARVHRSFPQLDVRHEMVEGTAVPVLADASRGCALIVVGNRGRGLLTGLLTGSVGNGLIRRAHSPLAVVH